MNYRMTDDEHARLIDACKPVPYMVFGGIAPESPTTKALRVWGEIAKRVGCVANTIGPSDTGDDRDFTGEPLR